MSCPIAINSFWLPLPRRRTNGWGQIPGRAAAALALRLPASGTCRQAQPRPGAAGTSRVTRPPAPGAPFPPRGSQAGETLPPSSPLPRPGRTHRLGGDGLQEEAEQQGGAEHRRDAGQRHGWAGHGAAERSSGRSPAAAAELIGTVQPPRGRSAAAARPARNARGLRPASPAPERRRGLPRTGTGHPRAGGAGLAAGARAPGGSAG